MQVATVQATGVLTFKQAGSSLSFLPSLPPCPLAYLRAGCKIPRQHETSEKTHAKVRFSI